MAMLFFGAGALLWYPPFLRTRFVPRWLGAWGVVSVLPVVVATLIHVWNRDLQPPFLLYALYLPFELVVGSWLLVKGSLREPGEAPRTVSRDPAGTPGRSA